MKIKAIGIDDAAQERDRVRQQEAERESKDRATSSKDREKEVEARNAERKQEREAATQALQSGNANLQEIARQGGSLGRRIEREIRRFEQTGRVSGWLAGETIKAEAAQNAAQQSAFRQAVVDVIQSSPSGSFDLVPAKPNIEIVTRKPDVTEEGSVPDGENKGDLLYWDTEDTPEWKVLEAPEESEDLKVLTIRNGQLEWTDTEDCGNESEE